MLLCALRLAVKLLLLSSFISWQPTITGSWWRGCTYIASSSWPSSLTRTTCGPSLSSAGVNSIADTAVTRQANSDWTDNTIFLFADIRCPSCIRLHLGQCPSIAGRHSVSQWIGSTILYLQDTVLKIIMLYPLLEDAGTSVQETWSGSIKSPFWQLLL